MVNNTLHMSNVLFPFWKVKNNNEKYEKMEKLSLLFQIENWTQVAN